MIFFILFIYYVNLLPAQANLQVAAFSYPASSVPTRLHVDTYDSSTKHTRLSSSSLAV